MGWYFFEKKERIKKIKNFGSDIPKTSFIGFHLGCLSLTHYSIKLYSHILDRIFWTSLHGIFGYHYLSFMEMFRIFKVGMKFGNHFLRIFFY